MWSVLFIQTRNVKTIHWKGLYHILLKRVTVAKIVKNNGKWYKAVHIYVEKAWNIRKDPLYYNVISNMLMLSC